MHPLRNPENFKVAYFKIILEREERIIIQKICPLDKNQPWNWINSKRDGRFKKNQSP